MPKCYLGDSVYVDFDGYSFELTTENGYPDDPRNRIILEPQGYALLCEYVKSINGDHWVPFSARTAGHKGTRVMTRWLRAWWDWCGHITLTLEWPAPPSREDWCEEGRGPIRS